jgi:hypothetical protein
LTLCRRIEKFDAPAVSHLKYTALHTIARLGRPCHQEQQRDDGCLIMSHIPPFLHHHQPSPRATPHPGIRAKIQCFTLPHGFRRNPPDSEQSAGIRRNMSFRWIPTESEWNMLESARICRNMSFRQIPRAIPADSHIPADSEGHSSRFIYNFIDTAISVSHVILNVTLRDQVTLLILCIHFIYVILNTKSILSI